MPNTPGVDIVVLNHNGKKFLDDCFISLRSTTYTNCKVHLLDNASTDDDVQWTRDHYPEVNIIQNPDNNGFCTAYNLALAATTGKYFVCLNNDVKVKPDWIDHLVDLAESDETIAALQCKMVSFFDEKQFEYAGSSGGMLDKYGYPFLRGRVFQSIEQDHGQYDDIAEVFWTCGAAMFIRRSVLEQTGNFDDTIVHHMDEIDLCWRMHMNGFICKVVPKSVILHYGGATIQSTSFKKMYWNHRNSVYVVMKNYGRRQAIMKTFVHFILDYMAAANSLVQGHFTHARAIFAAHWWIITHFFLIIEKRKEVQMRRKVSDEVILKKMYPKSVALQYFLFGKKTYSDVMKSINK
jgi:hypothetical protein